MSIQKPDSSVDRTGNVVTIWNSSFNAEFDTDYGGAWHGFRNPLGVQCLEYHPGEAASAYANTGQDATQAGADGMTINCIDCLGDNIYETHLAREVLITPTTYETSGAFPAFWLSHEEIDDAHPTDNRPGDHGWSTMYHPIDGEWDSFFIQPGTPIRFVPSANRPSGIIFVGNEMYRHNRWNKEIYRMSAPYFFWKVKFDFSEASPDSIVSIMANKQIPTKNNGIEYTIDDAYSARGIHLDVNAQGGYALKFGGVLLNSGVVSSEYLNKSWTLYYHPSDKRLYLYIGETLLFSQSISLDAMMDGWSDGFSHALFGQGSSGSIVYWGRTIAELNLEYRTRAEEFGNKLELEQEVYLIDESLPSEFYRFNLPQAFTAHGVRETSWAYDKLGNVITREQLEQRSPSEVVDLNEISAAWSGRADGSAGLYVDTIRPSTGGGHALVSNVVLGLNPLPYSANTSPVQTSRASIKSRWSPVCLGNLP